jgi:hypothetical protein
MRQRQHLGRGRCQRALAARIFVTGRGNGGAHLIYFYKKHRHYTHTVSCMMYAWPRSDAAMSISLRASDDWENSSDA